VELLALMRLTTAPVVLLLVSEITPLTTLLALVPSSCRRLEMPVLVIDAEPMVMFASPASVTGLLLLPPVIFNSVKETAALPVTLEPLFTVSVTLLRSRLPRV